MSRIQMHTLYTWPCMKPAASVVQPLSREASQDLLSSFSFCMLHGHITIILTLDI